MIAIIASLITKTNQNEKTFNFHLLCMIRSEEKLQHRTTNVVQRSDQIIDYMHLAVGKLTWRSPIQFAVFPL